MLHSQNYLLGRQGTVPGGNGSHSENYSHVTFGVNVVQEYMSNSKMLPLALKTNYLKQVITKNGNANLMATVVFNEFVTVA